MRFGLGLAALAALVTAPLAAQETSADPLRGVWHGAIGDLPVTACFEGDDDRGVYYYDRHKKLIRLTNEDGFLFESIGWGDPSGEGWRLLSLEGETLRGRWESDARSLPIELTRREWSTRDEYGGPCESAAFNQLRFEGGSVLREAARLGARDYTVLRYVPPAHWQAQDEDDFQDVTIASFEIPETNRGDRAINHALAFYLPRGDAGDAFADCMALNAASQGVDGDFNQEASPELLTDRWLGMIENNSVYCGGAHPSYWQVRRVFDRYSGEEVPAESWLNDMALAREILGSDEDADVFATVSETLQPVLLGHWSALPANPSEEDREYYEICFETARSTAFWDFGLAGDGSGMAFIPSMPHAATACVETVVVPWGELAPFLTLEGQAVMQSLTAAD